MSHTRMTTLAFYFWSYFPFLCLNLILCLCSVNLRNILMILGGNVEQDKMTCCVQELQLWGDCACEGGNICFVCLLLLLFFLMFFLKKKKQKNKKKKIFSSLNIAVSMFDLAIQIMLFRYKY